MTPPATAQLLDEQNVPGYLDAVRTTVERLASTIAGTDQPSRGALPADLRGVVAGIDLDTPLGDLTGALGELEEVYLRDAVYFHHPLYMAHLNCPVVLPAVAAEAVLAAVNSSLDTWDQSVGGTLIEQRLVRWTCERIGLGPDADGVFTSGGTQSNLQALTIAREHARARSLTVGRPTGTPRILASDCSHFSVATAAKLLGLDPDAVRPVATDARRRMRPDALAAELARCRADGDDVIAVVATAGTTDFGSIDPLAPIADECARTGTWLHVDAAYGCGLLVSRRRSGALAGVERADSVTVDFHKSFFQPVSASAVVLRDRGHLRHVAHHADYLNPRDARGRATGHDQVDKSLQTTRRFDALKLWMTLRVMGADALGELFDEVVDRAAQAWAVLDADPRFEVVVAPELSSLVFRYRPAADVHPDLVDELNRHARHALFRSGRAAVAGTTVDGRHHLKITLLNPRTSLADVGEVLDRLAGHAEKYLAELGVA